MPTKPAKHVTAHQKSARADYERRRKKDGRLGAAKRIRDSARWQHFREWFRSLHPLCADPFYLHARKGCVVPSQQVHHIKPLADFLDLAFDEDNCAALCESCHTRIETLERSGKRTQGLFAMGEVTIVAGPPGAGKSTYVRERMRDGDVLVDVDALMCALTGKTSHERNMSALPFVLAAKQAVLALLGKGIRGGNAWVTTLAPTPVERSTMALELKARVVVLAVPYEECMRRIANDGTRRARDGEWSAIVRQWWADYAEATCDSECIKV